MARQEVDTWIVRNQSHLGRSEDMAAPLDSSPATTANYHHGVVGRERERERRGEIKGVRLPGGV